jgi:Tol biopolymer transport system component/DNA-binding winged helix-turn-helix (wHTH) protein
MSTTASNSKIAFGLYEVDLQAEELWKSGFRVRLQSQPFKILVALLEQPGRIVTREELQSRLWDKGTTVDFEHSLAAAINKIREALGDSADNPRFVETLARRGYRFIAPVSLPAPAESKDDPTKVGEHQANPENDSVAMAARMAEPRSAETSAVVGPAISIPTSLALPDRGWNRKYAALAAAFCAGFVVAFILWSLTKSRSSTIIPPHITQLTHDGHLAVGPGSTETLPAGATDGFHLFVPVIEDGRSTIATVPVSGGSAVNLNIPEEVASPLLSDISPDGSHLLLRNHLSAESEQPLWVVPTSGGSALRLGHVLAHDATWMPNGSDILYAAEDGLYLVDASGENPHLFATLAGRAFWLRWNPTGKLLRFTIVDPIAHTESLWQLSASDRKPRQLLDDFMSPDTECCGVWTSDGSSFVFQSTRGGDVDLWKLSGDATDNPVRLTDGPLQFESPVAARDGRRIFFLGADSRSQLDRVSATGSLVPEKGFLSSAVRVEFSRNGKWVAWTDNSGRLWRAAPDGSQKLQLTPDALYVFLASWSPDGSRLAFMGREPGKAWRNYLVPVNGGDIQPLLNEARNAADPSWGPDGNSLVFGRINDVFGKESAARTLQVLNLQTNQVSEVPGSDGLFSPRWSPDGRYIAALSLDQRQVRLFDVAARTWITLNVPSGADPVWSSDSRYLYVHAALDPAQPIDRIAIPDGHVQEIVRLSDSSESDAVDYVFGGLTADNVPLVRARIFTANLYSEEVK